MKDSWRVSILALPSETFLDLMRAYLGGLRTPYRKDELVDQLEAFLKRPETVDRIFSLFDERDAQAVSAVIALGAPTREELISFLGGDRVEVMSRIVNLEERLLLYEERVPRRGSALRLTPALAAEAAKRAWEPALIFPSAPLKEGEEGQGTEALAGDSSLLCLTSFFRPEERWPSIKTDGSPRLAAKLSREFDGIFGPALELGRGVSILMSMGLLRESDSRLRFDEEALRAIAASGSPLSALAAASAAAPVAGTEAEGRLAVKDRARGILAALAMMPPGRAFLPEAAERFVMLGLREAGIEGPETPATYASLAAGMEAAGLLRRSGSGIFKPSPSRAKKGPKGSTPDTGKAAILSVGADFSVLARPGLPSAYLPALSLFLDPKRAGQAAELALTRDSASRAYHAGYGAADLIGLLEGLSGAELPQNIRFSLESWEGEHRSATIAEGIMIYGDERLARFMEHAPIMRASIRECLGPGVYLTSFASAAEAKEALRKAGFHSPPRILGPSGSPRREKDPFPSPPDPLRDGPPLPPAQGGEMDLSPRRPPPALDSAALVGSMLEHIETITATKDVKDALEERVRLKLALGPGSLNPESVKRDRGEAGGLDYLGKVKLVEKAIHEPTWLLSILYRDPAGDPRRVVLRPARIRKTAQGLLLEGATEIEGEELSIPVERMSLIKRIRTSIFG